MIKFLLSAYFIFSTILAQACLLNGAQLLPANSQFALSQSVYDEIVIDPSIGTAILAARDAWDNTDAIDRIGAWNGITNPSNCPTGQSMQIGAEDFNNLNNCAAINSNNVNALAFVDYGNTNSITLNLHYPWSLSPLSGEHDIQSVLTHEFGHVLGLAHEQTGTCNESTMNYYLTCQSTSNAKFLLAQIAVRSR